jgi:hypothetical protein
MEIDDEVIVDNSFAIFAFLLSFVGNADCQKISLSGLPDIADSKLDSG